MPVELRPARPWWTTAAAFTIGVALVQFCSRSFLWFLPYNVAGFVNETVLLALVMLIGVVVYVVRRQKVSPPPARLASVTGGVLYVLLSSSGLGWSNADGLGFGVHRYALFSTPDCEFAARFQQPPQHGRIKGVLHVGDAPGETPLLYVALLGDVATATAYRAECLPLPAGSAGDAVAEQVARGIVRWAQESGLRASDATLTTDGRGRILRLDGSIGGSILPQQEGRPARTLVGLRSYLGERSVMMVYVFQPQGDTLSSEAHAFLDGVRRR